jgi:hypothetical protein
MNIALLTSPDLRRLLPVTALALLPLTLAGCGVVAVAGSVAGAAITVGSAAVSVGATVVTTGVKVTGKAIGKTLDAVSGEPAAAAAEGGGGIVVAPLPGEPGASGPAR